MTHEYLPSRENEILDLECQLDGLALAARDGDVPALYDVTRNSSNEEVELVVASLPTDVKVCFTRTVSADLAVPTRYVVMDIDDALFSGGRGAVLTWDSTTRDPSLTIMHGVLQQESEAATQEIAKVGAYVAGAINGEITSDRPFVPAHELTVDEVLDPEGTQRQRMQDLFNSVLYLSIKGAVGRTTSSTEQQAAITETLLQEAVDPERGVSSDEGIGLLIVGELALKVENILAVATRTINAQSRDALDHHESFRRRTIAEKAGRWVRGGLTRETRSAIGKTAHSGIRGKSDRPFQPRSGNNSSEASNTEPDSPQE